MTWRQPLDKFKLGTKFGVKDAAHPNGHRGVDYNGFPAGTPLKAVTDGEIVLNKWSGVLGWVIVLKVNDKAYFGYCHMKTQSKLKPGTKVKAGDEVGQAGTTGSASSGVHLHLTLGNTADSVFSGTVRDAYAAIEKHIQAEKEPSVKTQPEK